MQITPSPLRTAHPFQSPKASATPRFGAAQTAASLAKMIADMSNNHSGICNGINALPESERLPLLEQIAHPNQLNLDPNLQTHATVHSFPLLSDEPTKMRLFKQLADQAKQNDLNPWVRDYVIKGLGLAKFQDPDLQAQAVQLIVTMHEGLDPVPDRLLEAMGETLPLFSMEASKITIALATLKLVRPRSLRMINTLISKGLTAHEQTMLMDTALASQHEEGINYGFTRLDEMPSNGEARYQALLGLSQREDLSSNNRDRVFHDLLHDFEPRLETAQLWPALVQTEQKHLLRKAVNLVPLLKTPAEQIQLLQTLADIGDTETQASVAEFLKTNSKSLPDTTRSNILTSLMTRGMTSVPVATVEAFLDAPNAIKRDVIARTLDALEATLEQIAFPPTEAES